MGNDQDGEKADWLASGGWSSAPCPPRWVDGAKRLTKGGFDGMVRKCLEALGLRGRPRVGGWNGVG